MTDQTQDVPNEHSAAIPAAQKVGLLDKTDPTKFSAEALAAPDSYVRNFAHAVQGHVAMQDEVAQETAKLSSESEVYDLVKEINARAHANGFKYTVDFDGHVVVTKL